MCLNDWVEQLILMRDALASDGGEHVFDEGEQGQPAFVFVRDKALVKVSIRASKLSDGLANPAWDDVPFDARGFLTAVDECLRGLESKVLEVGEAGKRWWDRQCRAAQATRG